MTMQSISGRLCLNQRFTPTLIISVLTQKQNYNILDIKALHGRRSIGIENGRNIFRWTRHRDAKG